MGARLAMGRLPFDGRRMGGRPLPAAGGDAGEGRRVRRLRAGECKGERFNGRLIEMTVLGICDAVPCLPTGGGAREETLTGDNTHRPTEDNGGHAHKKRMKGTEPRRAGTARVRSEDAMKASPRHFRRAGRWTYADSCLCRRGGKRPCPRVALRGGNPRLGRALSLALWEGFCGDDGRPAPPSP